MSTSAVNGNPAQSIFTQLNQGSSIANSQSSTSASATSASDIQNRFLTLLTAQLQNQDPTNPMDSSQLTSQLAEISTVQGIQDLNTTVQTLLTNISDSQSVQASSLVGQNVLVPASTLTLTSNGALGGIDLAGNADKVTVAIKDATGATVKTINAGSLNAGVNQFTWDGTTDSGGQAAVGSYTFSVTATQGPNNVSATPLSLGTVTSINSSGNTTAVNVAGLGSFPLSSVSQIY